MYALHVSAIFACAGPQQQQLQHCVYVCRSRAGTCAKLKRDNWQLADSRVITNLDGHVFELVMCVDAST
jgi:hypothetical protein